MSINKVVISGNLTREPEMRQTAGGMSVMTVGIAVNDRRKNQQTGEWEDYPNFIDCTMFGNRAEGVSRFLGKGSKVCIEGKLRWSQWDGKDGHKRSKIEVIVDEIEFMSRSNAESWNNGAGAYKSTYDDETDGYRPQNTPQTPRSNQEQPFGSLYDEDIPFD